MALNLPAGTIGQIRGPFSQGYSISFTGVKIKLGISIGEKDFMKAGDPNEKNGFAIQINDQTIRLGRTYLYETDDATNVTRLVFPQGAPASLIIDYVVLEA